MSGKPRKKQSGGTPWKMLVAGIVAVVIIAGAAVSLMRPKEAAYKATPIDANATSIEGAPPMPTWLAKADPLIKTEYMWAASNLAALQYIPCYCGCEHDGHSDNFACYYDRDKGGRITGYDSMSLS